MQVNATSGQAVWGNAMGDGEGVAIAGVVTLADGSRCVVVAYLLHVGLCIYVCILFVQTHIGFL